MQINYNKLFTHISHKGISKSDFRKMAGISTVTLAKLSKNESVGMEIISKICDVLDCQPGDILTFERKSKNPLLERLIEEMQMDLSGSLYYATQVKLAYNSNHIEGSRLSEEQTRYIFETNTIGITKQNSTTNIDDIIETTNHFAAFRYLLKIAQNELSEEIIKEFHKILKNGTSDSRKNWFRVGEYKARANVVGNRETSDPKNVEKDIKRLLEQYNASKTKTLEDLIDFHYQFERIHPFQDGNGRVGRLILFKECLKHSIPPVLIEDEFKLFYYRGLAEYEREKGFLTDTFKNGQDSYAHIMALFD